VLCFLIEIGYFSPFHLLLAYFELSLGAIGRFNPLINKVANI
jgi:hypothetical protein